MNSWRLGHGASWLIAILLLLASCAPLPSLSDSVTPDTTPTSATLPPIVDETSRDRILAEAVVEPARQVTLLSPFAARVDRVPVQDGVVVGAGDLLAQLGASDADIALDRARAGLAQAEASLSEARAGATPEELGVLAAQNRLAEAHVAVASARRDLAASGLAAADVLAAEAELAETVLAFDRATSTHDDTMVCYDVALPDGSSREVCPALGTLEEMARARMEAAAAGLEAARAHLDIAQDAEVRDVALAGNSVASAVATQAAAQARLALGQAGARVEEVRLAESGAAEARAALAQAQDLVDRYSIEAPFGGTVADVAVVEGETLAAGSRLLTLATLDRLQLRTVDLTELEVGRVSEGRQALVEFDAMPGSTFRATVARLEPQGRLLYGDAVYDVVLSLDEPPEWLRWGMTAQVQIAETSDTALSIAEGTAGRVRTDASLAVLAEGRARAVRQTTLHFARAGQIASLSVQVGELVAAGDVLAALDQRAGRLALAQAEAALARSQREVDLARTLARAEEVAEAEAQIAAAEAGLERARLQRTQLTAGVHKAELAAATAEREALLAERRGLEASRRWAEDGGDVQRASDLNEDLAVLMRRLAAVDARLISLPGAHEARLREADAGVAAATAQVAAAEAVRDRLLAAPEKAPVERALAYVASAQADVAEARLALTRTLLVAPHDGTVTALFAEVGDTAAPDRPVLTVADLDDLEVEITDLTELDIVRLCVGQAVTFTVDALPGASWAGHLASLGYIGVRTAGDVLYPGVVVLAEPVPGLLPRMTTAIAMPTADRSCDTLPSQ